MIDISISNLSKEFEVGKKILDGLTFQVDQGERVGLLGKNGAGKTTLFKVLTGELDWDEGEVHVAPGKGVGLISQIPVYPPAYTVEDVLQTAFDRLHAMEAEMARLAEQMGADTDPALLRRYDALTAAFEAGGGYDTQTELNKVCNGLEISQDMRGQLFSSLSGGEKTRVNLARLILEDTDILLLDEPTNHLDFRATEWLEEYLDRYKGTVLAISHDRWFLDRVVRRVIEIHDGKAEFYAGNYSFYVEEKERRYEEKLKQYEKEQAKLEQLQEAVDKLHLWAFMGNDKLHKRAFSIEKRMERIRTTDKPTKERRLDIKFGESEFRGDEVLTIKELLLARDEQHIADIMETEVITAETTEDQEEAVARMMKYDFISLPVVDKEGRLVGIVTVDDVMDVMEEEATEDFEKMAAMAPSEKPYLKTGVFTLAKHRILWLLVLMISGMITGGILGRYEAAFSVMPLLVTFIPMLTDTGGNAGSQSSTLVIRGMAVGDIELRDFLRVFWKEFRVSLLVGAVLSAVNFVRLIITYPGNEMIALTVALALFVTVLLAKTVGGVLPMAAKLVHADPAIMAAPLITTIVDAISLVVYFKIASALLAL